MTRPVLIALLALACTGEAGRSTGDEPVPDAAAARTTAARPTKPVDSLVLTAPGGVEVWYTLAREGKGGDGTACVDRTLEIRRGDTRVPVPLLYTGNAPELVNDTTMRARLSDRCQPGAPYLVNLRTGRPVPER